MKSKKSILKLICLITIISFLFPFLLVSCNDQEIGTLSAMDLVTGSNIQGEVIDPVPLAVIMLIIVIVAFVGTFLKNRIGMVLPMVSNAVATIMLLVLRAQTKAEIANQGLDVSFRFGFYLMLLSMIAAVIFSIYQAINKHGNEDADNADCHNDDE